MKRSAQNSAVLVAVFLCGLFFGGVKAHAYSALYDNDMANASNSGVIADVYANDWNEANTFTATYSGTPYGVFFAMTTDATSPSMDWCIYHTTTVANITATSTAWGCGKNAPVASTDPLTSYANGNYTGSDLVAGEGYTIVFFLENWKIAGGTSAALDGAPSGIGNAYYGWRYSASGNEGTWFGPCPTTNCGSTGGPIAFQIYGTPGGGGYTPPSVDMYFPGLQTFNSSSTPFSDFSTWQVFIPGTINAGAQVTVFYDKDPAKLNTGTEYGVDSRLGTVAPLDLITDIRKTRALSPGKWYVQANYTDVATFTSTSSAVEFFYIATSSGIYPPGVSPTSSPVYNPGTGNSGIYNIILATTTESCAQYSIGVFSSTTWDGVACVVRQSAYNVLSWLFIPPKGVQDWFQSAIDFSDVVPFNIIMGVRDRIQVSGTFVVTASSTPSNTTYSVKNPWNGETTVLITSSTFRDALIGPSCNLSCANSAKADFQTYGNAAVWMATSVAVIALFL